VSVEDVLFHGLIAHQMLLDNPFCLLGCHVVIPDPLRINHQNGPPLTNSETIALGAVDSLGTFREAEFLQAALEVGVQSGGSVRGTAGARADKDVFSIRPVGGGVRFFHRMKN
jgi:hypothetical protein